MEKLSDNKVINIYNDFLNKKIKKTPIGFWDDNALTVLKYVIEEKHQIKEDEVLKRVNSDFLKDNGLNSLFTYKFKSDLFLLINTIYPNKYKPWMLPKVKRGFWDNEENCKEAIKWLVEDKLKLNDEGILNLSYDDFNNNGLGSLFSVKFQKSKRLAIDLAYPNRFKPWEFKGLEKKYWNKNRGKEAVKWLIEDKLKLTDEQLKEQLSVELFVENNLYMMLVNCFDGSYLKAILETYPNKFQPWEFDRIVSGYWDDDENCKKALNWMIKDKLKLSKKQLKEQLSINLFREVGLDRLLVCKFNSSPYKAINFLYPGEFKEWEFKNVPLGYWQSKENCIKAIKWLIEEKLKYSEEDVKNKLSVKSFSKYGLSGLLSNGLGGSYRKGLEWAYPNIYGELDFNRVAHSYWRKEANCIKATKWLIEDKLSLSENELKDKLSRKLFIENGLSGLLSHGVLKTPWDLINATYPNKYKREDFKNLKAYDKRIKKK